MIEKEVTGIGVNGEDIIKNISCILYLLIAQTFMARSLPNLANNVSEGTHKIKCKYGHDENVKLLEFHRKCATVVLNIQTLKMI